MRTEPSYIIKEYEQLYKRLIKQMGKSTGEEEDFLWEHLAKLRTLIDEYQIRMED